MEMLLLVAEDRAYSPQAVSNSQSTKQRLNVFDYVETLLQSKATAFDDWISEPYGIRAEGRISLSACQRNRVQATVHLRQAIRSSYFGTAEGLVRARARCSFTLGTKEHCRRSMHMPRYYFDYLDHPDLCDKVGAELANDAAAKQEAISRAQDAKSTHSLVAFKAIDAIAVRNEAGEQIFKTLIP